MKKLFLITVMVLAALLACTKTTEQPGGKEENPGGEEVNPGGETTEATITLLSEAEVNVPVEGDLVTIKFKATAAWTAASDADWATLSADKGDAGEACTLKVSIVKNEATDVRSAKVTITCDKSKAEVVITQGQVNDLRIAVTEYTVPAEGGDVEVVVSANVDYEVVIPEAVDWVTAQVTKGMAESKIVFTVNETHQYADEYLEDWSDEHIVRTANITIKAGELASGISIGQKTFCPYFDYTGDWAGLQWSFYEGVPTVIPQEGADIVIPVETNIDWRVYFSVWDNDLGAMVDCWDVEWAHLSFDVDKAEIHLVVDANDTYFGRDQYLYAECSIDGIPDGSFGGLGQFHQDGLVPQGATASLIWKKAFGDENYPVIPAYNRLAYKVDGGDALLVSDGVSVHAISPSDGTYWKAITWDGVTPASICNDDAGHVVIADHLTAEQDFTTWEMISGAEYKMYWFSNISDLHEMVLPNGVWGALGGIRARGDLATKGSITGFAGSAAYWFGYDIADFAAVPNYYGSQNSGPFAGVNTVWGPTTAAVISLDADLHGGVLYRGYDGNESIYYRSDAYTPAWAVGDAYEPWILVSDAGHGGNENQNNMDVIEYNGRKLLACTQGFHFSYSDNATIYILDVTNPAAAEVLLTIPSEDYIIAENGWFGVASADVMWYATDDGLLLYVVHSDKATLACFSVTL
ncbi:MAG: BACON domain-containing protein [Bacteroidales bacterium]|nr:BACON domain-containing protein [Bacteroidales bacterium]